MLIHPNTIHSLSQKETSGSATTIAVMQQKLKTISIEKQV